MDYCVCEDLNNEDFLQTMADESDDLNAGNTLPELSEEAYKNAEVMLTEMLEYPPK